ncbi:MAG TPA: nitrate reductase molybdenum cofactor assembly chaperone [Candidatus Dormibacteraeota bacterium]|nr:nitrate reductase molybdenum cofactor assembly chaperone [Candidatus Dormibacteraeota bacterium]
MSALRRRRPPYKLLSVLLQYPDEALVEALPAIADAIAALPSPWRRPLTRFHGHLAATPPVALRQAYVETFDLQRRASLYLTYFTHGDTRRRGMALLALKRRYAAAGLVLAAGELPDYLPLMLEFAALAPSGAGEPVLADHRAGLELLRLALRERGSPYADVLDAVCAGLPSPAREELETVRRLAVEGPPTEQVGLQPFAPPEVMPGMEART